MGEAKQVIARNKKAFHDYFVLDTYEAGLELFGTEIKSIRQGKVNLKDRSEVFAGRKGEFERQLVQH